MRMSEREAQHLRVIWCWLIALYSTLNVFREVKESLECLEERASVRSMRTEPNLGSIDSLSLSLHARAENDVFQSECASDCSATRPPA